MNIKAFARKLKFSATKKVEAAWRRIGGETSRPAVGKKTQYKAQSPGPARPSNPVGEPALSVDAPPIFFVVGRAKSGTSWLMRILDSHPEIMCKGEGRFFGRNFKQENLEEARKGKIQPSSLYRAILEAGYLKAWIERSVWTVGDNVEEHLENLTRLATSYFLAQRLAESGKRIVGDKTPFISKNMVAEIGRIHPQAKVVHIVRDGRDAAVSIVHHRWNNAGDKGGIYGLERRELEKRDAYREDPEKFVEAGESLFTEKLIEGMANGWRNQVTQARHNGHTLGANYMEVRYEDLLEKPEEEVQRLLDFLGADDSSDDIVKACIDSASFEKWTKGRKRGEEDAASFFRKGVAGDWKSIFTERDKQVFKDVAGDLLIELGYEKDKDW